MTIQLTDIRTAVMNYVDSNVTITTTALPQSSPTINPGESFSFQLNATNASAANGGIPLKNVVWWVAIQEGTSAKLIVPNEPFITRTGLATASPTLTPGAKVTEMYIFPRAVDNYLTVGDTDSIIINCQANDSPMGGAGFVFCRIYASVDHAWLFPKNQDSIAQGRYIEVIG